MSSKVTKKHKISCQCDNYGCNIAMLDANVQGNDNATSAEKMMADMKTMFDQKMSQMEQKM